MRRHALVLAHTAPEPSGALEERDDDELIAFARNGVPEGFDVLIRRHQKRVIGIATKELGDASLACDVAQLTFVEIHAYLPRYQPSGKFRSFLYRVLLNQCRIARRRMRRTSERESIARDFSSQSPQLCAQDEIVRKDRQQRLDSAIGTLSDKHRVVIVLRFAGELSCHEIAETLGIPTGTVRSRLFIALEALRKKFEDGSA